MRITARSQNPLLLWAVLTRRHPAADSLKTLCRQTRPLHAAAARKSRQVIRQMRRANAAAKVVVTGCYAELAPQDIEALGVDMVVGNEQKDQLPDLLTQAGWLIDAEPVPAIDGASFITPTCMSTLNRLSMRLPISPSMQAAMSTK